MPRWNNKNCGFQKGHPIYWKKPPMLGKKHSKDWKNKMSRKLMGNKNGFRKGIYQGYGFKKGHIPWDKNKKRPEMSGKNNPNWNDGSSFEPYTADWNITLKRAIRERDNYICQLCSQYGNTVHHIDYNKKNCNPSNLITLCNKCNLKVNYKRKYWQEYFQQINVE